jgi:hypothetical protein
MVIDKSFVKARAKEKNSFELEDRPSKKSSFEYCSAFPQV